MWLVHRGEAAAAPQVERRRQGELTSGGVSELEVQLRLDLAFELLALFLVESPVGVLQLVERSGFFSAALALVSALPMGSRHR
jgi:hypothetical protein